MLTNTKLMGNLDRSQGAYMLGLQKYYTMPQISPKKGTCEVTTISSAQSFLCQRLQAKSENSSQQKEQAIQHSLWSLCKASQSPIRAQAALTFRCFVVNAAKVSIDSLVNKFAPQLGQARQSMMRQDLYPCVIDDDGQLINVLPMHMGQSMTFDFSDRQHVGEDVINSQPINHQAFSLKVLSTFDPSHLKGESLKNWTHRLVKQNQEIKSVLREYGIHFSNPWQFLSRIKPQQLRQIETQFSNLPYTTIDEHVIILTALRLVHQENRRCAMKNKANSNIGKQSLSRIEDLRLRLEASKIYFPNTTELEAKLKEMMVVLLQYKARINQPESIHVPSENGSTQTDFERLIPDTDPTGFDALTVQAVIKFQAQIQEKFQPTYQNHRISLLDQSIQKTIQQRQDFLARRSQDRPQKYILALQLFFCEGLSMTEIAPKVQLSSQGQVSRLLRLSANSSNQSPTSPNLISSCMLHMAQQLSDQFYVWTQTFSTVEERQLLEEETSLLWKLLDAPIQDITQIFQQARAEISHPLHSRTSLFAQRTCNLLNHTI